MDAAGRQHVKILGGEILHLRRKIERGFICAQTISYDDFVALGGEAGAKEAGRAHDEGQGYVVQDGDVILFKFNV